MELFFIHDGVLEYEDKTHTYYFNGNRCISVTQLLKELFPEKYDGIPEEILKKAAEKGTFIHSAIELYETMGLLTEELQEFRNYLFLKNYYRFKVLENEKPIVIEYKGVFIAGRLDMVVDDKEIGDCLVDIKSTSQLDMDYLSWQLSLYHLGYEQTYHKTLNGLKAIHLKNDKRAYKNVNKIAQDELFKFLDKYVEKGKINTYEFI